MLVKFTQLVLSLAIENSVLLYQYEYFKLGMFVAEVDDMPGFFSIMKIYAAKIFFFFFFLNMI